MKLPPEEGDCSSDLSQWHHCSNNRGLPDDVLIHAWEAIKNISFVFHQRSHNVVLEKENKIEELEEDSSSEDDKN